MADLTKLAKNLTQGFSGKTDEKVSAATTQIINTVKETVVHEVIKEETGGVDISGLATKAELDGYATKSYVAGKALETAVDITDAAFNGNFAKIWKDFDVDNNSKGYFLTKKVNTDGSYAQLWNEPDGGGSQYFNKGADVISYVGTNDGGEDGICVQIYSKSYSGANYKEEEVDGLTEISGLPKNSGVRINVNPKGAYYTKGTNTSANGGDKNNEIATKGDVKKVETSLNNHVGSYVNLRNRVTELEALVAKLETALANVKDSDGNPVYQKQVTPPDDEIDEF